MRLAGTGKPERIRILTCGDMLDTAGKDIDISDVDHGTRLPSTQAASTEEETTSKFSSFLGHKSHNCGRLYVDQSQHDYAA
jgi:hypothetical protein